MTHKPPILNDEFNLDGLKLSLSIKGTFNQTKISSVRYKGGGYFIRNQEVVQNVIVGSNPLNCGMKLYVLVVMEKGDSSNSPMEASISLNDSLTEQEYKHETILATQGDIAIFRFQIVLKCAI